ncbi:type IV pilus modification protein PilV [Cupriavidus agavae]|uniref:Type IV pilus assembly protein PilV n=1 Tax=Cupriavidus agavae TaxID=1001822 RepID=A0A4Q7S6B1_9BURK|nr:type IV pilus modification protein PilV [Cupriavidus agavae]RZT41397.1 type IV pilus assembly protein PilV [Cupriavidus agavae]
MGQYRCREAAGFTMLEALVAIVVLAVGVLGVANLLIKSFRFAQQSSYDVVALQLANEMADRLRANDAVTNTAGGYDTFDTNNGIPNLADNANPYRVACGGNAATCAPLTAAFDQAELSRQVQSNLPKGRAVICRDASSFNNDTGFSWNCVPGAGGAASTPLVIKIGWVSRFTESNGSNQPDATDARGNAKPQIAVVVLPGASN